jgi:AbrB family looped-hinge helix DNA binding protein
MSAPHSSTVLSSKGQVVIPKLVRQALGLRAGDRLEVNMDPEKKRVVLQPKRRRNWRELRGAFGRVEQTTSRILAEVRREEFDRENRI